MLAKNSLVLGNLALGSLVLGSLALVIFTLAWLRFKHKKKTNELLLKNRQIRLSFLYLLALQEMQSWKQPKEVST